MVSVSSITSFLKPRNLPTKAQEDEGLGRAALEKFCGTVQVVNRIPTAVVPAVVAGVAHGVTGGLDEKQLARVLDVAAGVQGAVTLVIAQGGQGKKRWKILPDGGSLIKHIGKQLLAAGGERDQLAKELAAHKPEGNMVQRAVSGAGKGLTTALALELAGAYQDGKADAAGLWEGGQLVPAILQDGENPESWMGRIAGGVSAVLLVPGAVADGLARALGAEQLASPLLVTAGSVAVVAFVGAATLGAPAAVVGGGLALVACIQGAKDAHEKVEEHFARLAECDLGDPEANDRKELVGALVIGGAAGARAGYGAWA